MKRYFSPSTQGFYIDEIEYSNLPIDIIEIDEDKHLFLLNAINEQHQKVAVTKSGDFVLSDQEVIITWETIVSKRNRLLSLSDYTQMPDWPGNKTAWAEYRQLLRDIPQTFETPNDVVWPTPPGE